MATIKICSIDTAFLPAKITAARYKMVNTQNGDIVDTGLVSLPEDIYTWNSALEDGTGGSHIDLELASYVKFYFGKEETEWIEVGLYDQNDQAQPVWECNGSEIVNVHII